MSACLQSISHPWEIPTDDLVLGTGIEPVRPNYGSGGFSSHYGFHRQTSLFVRWTMPSPWLCSVRCPPSSLYTFPFLGLARRCLGLLPGVSPNLRGFTQVLSHPGAQFSKSAVSTYSTTRADGNHSSLVRRACVAWYTNRHKRSIATTAKR